VVGAKTAVARKVVGEKTVEERMAERTVEKRVAGRVTTSADGDRNGKRTAETGDECERRNRLVARSFDVLCSGGVLLCSGGAPGGRATDVDVQ